MQVEQDSLKEVKKTPKKCVYFALNRTNLHTSPLTQKFYFSFDVILVTLNKRGSVRVT